MRHGLILVVLLAACGGDDGGGGGDGDGDGDGGRGPIPTRDLEGSCAGACGEPAPAGNCFCDEDCTFHGDCCGDHVDLCRSEGAGTCGGFAGLDCEGDTYCHYEPSEVCGAGDQAGTCIEPPGDCTEASEPVCGCDGETYDNACLAARGQTSVAADGACR